METMRTDSPRRSDDPAHGLGPTRARVLALLQDSREPLTAAVAGARLGLHANSVRVHLDGLLQDGLVQRLREERTTPGRPRTMYAAASGAPGVAHRSYRMLAEILTSLVSDTLPAPAASAEAAGRAWGRHLATAPDGSRRAEESEVLDSLVETLDHLGFDTSVADDPGSLHLQVSHCPFLEVAEGNTEVVCAVHLGLIRGILDQTGASVTATSLDPLVEPTLCVAHLQRDGAAS
jgi:predicted ArsR family transcriptional regulator